MGDKEWRNWRRAPTQDTSTNNRRLCVGAGCNDPLWPTPAVCAISKPSDVHVPLCDKAAPAKCSKEFYFDQNQCAQVPGDNWSNDTKDVYQGLVCKGKSCNCGKYPWYAVLRPCLCC